MTTESEELRTESKVVVFFDICSSSSIIEDLKSTDNLCSMRDLLISLKEFLVGSQTHAGFKAYKFLGDGWILLFPDDVSGDLLLRFLESLCKFFRHKFRSVERRLQVKPSIIGLTFGIDKGALVRIRMMGQTEYVGRPLNVASRLQAAIKDRDDHPAYKCLLSRHAYLDLSLSRELKHKLRRKHVRRTMRNIQGGQSYRCVKLTLLY